MVLVVRGLLDEFALGENRSMVGMQRSSLRPTAAQLVRKPAIGWSSNRCFASPMVTG